MENIKLDFNKYCKVSSLKLTLAVLGTIIVLLPAMALSRFAPDLYNWIPNNTKRILTQTLVIYLIAYFIFIYLILNKSSKIKSIELGLDKSKLKNGILLTLILFLVLQLYGAVYSYLTIGKFVISQVMTKWTVVVGYYIELIFGVALFEEVVFRGFLIPQVFIRLKSNKSISSKMLLTLAISQLLFSIVHIPIRIINGINFGTLIVSLCAIFVIGLVLAFIYLLTENLFLAMGVHALWDAANNNAASIFSSNYTAIIVGLMAFIIMYVKITASARKNSGISVDK